MIGILSGPLNPNRQALPAQMVGAEIANQDFLKNMLRHLPAGGVGLFATESAVPLVQQEILRLQENAPSSHCPASVWGIHALPQVLATQAFTAFHNGVAPQLHQLSYIRSQFSPRPFPITCVTHGLSQQYLLWEIFVRLLMTPTLPCDSIVCTSQAARRAFRSNLEQVKGSMQEAGVSSRNPAVRTDVIPLGIDVGLYHPRDRRDVRTLLGLPQEKTMLLSFGRIDHVTKGDLHPLLLAFRELLNRHGDNLVLVLAGNISESGIENIQRSITQSGCAKHVLLRPQPPMIEGPLYYAAADIFVSLSETLQESFGLSPLEAMASGLPVVVSDWSGYHETVVPGVTGFHVKTYWAECDEELSIFAPLQGWRDDHVRLSQSVAVDLHQLIECLDILISIPERRATMGEAARQHIAEHYSWPGVIAQYYELWQELAQIAKGLPQVEQPRQSLPRPHYFKNFGHFASVRLRGSEALSITERGRCAQHHPETLWLHPEMQPVLSAKLLMVILKVVKMATFFKYGITIQEVCGKIGPRHHTSPQAMLSHIMWLIKYGHLRVAHEEGVETN